MSEVVNTGTAAAVAPGLLTELGPDARLIGSRCTECQTVSFPEQRSCPSCTSVAVSRHLLAERGRLWSFTIQGFEPKQPYLPPASGFAPYGVGYVELGGEVIVEGRLTTAEPDQLRIGMAMRLVLEPFTTTADGHDLVTYAFAPDEEISR